MSEKSKSTVDSFLFGQNIDQKELPGQIVLENNLKMLKSDIVTQTVKNREELENIVEILEKKLEKIMNEEELKEAEKIYKRLEKLWQEIK